MKVKIIAICTLSLLLKLHGMEENIHELNELMELKKIIKEMPSQEFVEAWKMVTERIPTLKTLAAYQIIKNGITIDNNKLPIEVFDFIKNIRIKIKQIRCILESAACNIQEKNVLLNIVNDNDFDIKKYFLEPLVRTLLRRAGINENYYTIEEFTSSYLREIALSPNSIFKYSINKGKQEVLDQMLLIGVDSGDINLVDAVLSLGANINIQDFLSNTPLMRATYFGYKEIVNLLIKKGADVNIQGDNNGETALILATMINNIEITKSLLQADAQVNFQTVTGDTALIQAVENNNKEIVQMLLDCGADINLQDIAGRTALTIAKERNRRDIVNLMQKFITKEKSTFCCTG